MKLISKEICPVTVRDRLIKNLAGQDVAVCDLVRATKWAEEKCLELGEKITKLQDELDIANEFLEEHPHIDQS